MLSGFFSLSGETGHTAVHKPDNHKFVKLNFKWIERVLSWEENALEAEQEDTTPAEEENPAPAEQENIQPENPEEMSEIEEREPIDVPEVKMNWSSVKETDGLSGIIKTEVNKEDDAIFRDNVISSRDEKDTRPGRIMSGIVRIKPLKDFVQIFNKRLPITSLEFEESSGHVIWKQMVVFFWMLLNDEFGPSPDCKEYVYKWLDSQLANRDRCTPNNITAMGEFLRVVNSDIQRYITSEDSRKIGDYFEKIEDWAKQIAERSSDLKTRANVLLPLIQPARFALTRGRYHLAICASVRIPDTGYYTSVVISSVNLILKKTDQLDAFIEKLKGVVLKENADNVFILGDLIRDNKTGSAEDYIAYFNQVIKKLGEVKKPIYIIPGDQERWYTSRVSGEGQVVFHHALFLQYDQWNLSHDFLCPEISTDAKLISDALGNYFEVLENSNFIFGHPAERKEIPLQNDMTAVSTGAFGDTGSYVVVTDDGSVKLL